MCGSKWSATGAPAAGRSDVHVLAGGHGNLAAVDLDGDGDLDLACANGDLLVFYQEAPGRFTATPRPPVNAGIISVLATDLDGDGDMDVLGRNNGSSNTMTVLLGRSR